MPVFPSRPVPLGIGRAMRNGASYEAVQLPHLKRWLNLQNRTAYTALLTVIIVFFATISSVSQELPSLSNNLEMNGLSHKKPEYTGALLAAPNKISDLTYSYSNKLKKGIFSLYSDRMMLYSFTASGLFANTGIDERLRSSYYKNIRSTGSNHFSRIAKHFGEGRIMFPSYIIGFLLGKTFNNNSLKEWGKNSFNATLISAPGLLVSQYSLGSSRPYMEYGSKWWRGMDGKNGASGHTWVAAIPFITTAKMTGNKYLKILLYTASTFTGISRINDDAHFVSQVLLGYAWAYCSVNSVFSRPVPLEMAYPANRDGLRRAAGESNQGRLQKKKGKSVSVNIGISGIGFTVSF